MKFLLRVAMILAPSAILASLVAIFLPAVLSGKANAPLTGKGTESTGFSVAWIEVKCAAMEADCGGEVIEVEAASSGGFQPLDFGVQAFADGVFKAWNSDQSARSKFSRFRS